MTELRFYMTELRFYMTELFPIMLSCKDKIGYCKSPYCK